jgi:hypothetical protein
MMKKKNEMAVQRIDFQQANPNLHTENDKSTTILGQTKEIDSTFINVQVRSERKQGNSKPMILGGILSADISPILEREEDKGSHRIIEKDANKNVCLIEEEIKINEGENNVPGFAGDGNNSKNTPVAVKAQLLPPNVDPCYSLSSLKPREINFDHIQYPIGTESIVNSPNIFTPKTSNAFKQIRLEKILFTESVKQEASAESLELNDNDYLISNENELDDSDLNSSVWKKHAPFSDGKENLKDTSKSQISGSRGICFGNTNFHPSTLLNTTQQVSNIHLKVLSKTRFNNTLENNQMHFLQDNENINDFGNEEPKIAEELHSEKQVPSIINGARRNVDFCKVYVKRPRFFSREEDSDIMNNILHVFDNSKQEGRVQNIMNAVHSSLDLQDPRFTYRPCTDNQLKEQHFDNKFNIINNYSRKSDIVLQKTEKINYDNNVKIFSSKQKREAKTVKNKIGKRASLSNKENLSP